MKAIGCVLRPSCQAVVIGASSIVGTPMALLVLLHKLPPRPSPDLPLFPRSCHV